MTTILGNPLHNTGRTRFDEYQLLIERIRQAAEQLIPEGSTVLGVSVEPLTPDMARQLGLSESRGILVRGVEDGSPAANAGLRPGDVIVEVDRHPVASVNELRQALDKHAKGTPLLVLLHRNGASRYESITLS